MYKILFFVTMLFSGISSFAQVNESGVASFYHDKYHGRLTANGEIFDNESMTAAHKTLPFGTIVEVTNVENNKKIVVRITDRGPFIDGRVIDLTKEGARQLDFFNAGLTQVELRIQPKNVPVTLTSKEQKERIENQTTASVIKE